MDRERHRLLELGEQSHDQLFLPEAVVKSRKGLATGRVVVVCMTHPRWGKKVVMKLERLSILPKANPVPSNVL
jgi:hypothetical protein